MALPVSLVRKLSSYFSSKPVAASLVYSSTISSFVHLRRTQHLHHMLSPRPLRRNALRFQQQSVPTPNTEVLTKAHALEIDLKASSVSWKTYMLDNSGLEERQEKFERNIPLNPLLDGVVRLYVLTV